MDYMMGFSSPIWLFTRGALLILVLISLKRRYLTSISDVSGPFFASFTGLWQIYQLLKGDEHIAMIELHRKLGGHQPMTADSSVKFSGLIHMQTQDHLCAYRKRKLVSGTQTLQERSSKRTSERCFYPFLVRPLNP